MATEKSPAFQLARHASFEMLTTEWLTSAAIRGLSLAEQGALFTDAVNAVTCRDKAFVEGLPFVGRVCWPPRRRPATPEALRQRVLARDCRTCQRCGSTDRPEVDHIHPYSLGGEDTEENLRVLCKPCNVRRGARLD